MNKTKKKLSESGREGARRRWAKVETTRHQLLITLSGLVDKKLLEWIQMSKVKWSNDDISKLIKHYQND